MKTRLVYLFIKNTSSNKKLKPIYNRFQKRKRLTNHQMGIPYYFYTLYRKYNKEKVMIEESELCCLGVRHLFFDYNSLIHPCAQQAIAMMTGDDTIEQIESKIIENTMLYTRHVINMIRAPHVHITIDGVAPRAKINQQRERRYKSHFFKNIQPVEETGISDSTPTWDSNRITPGTKFMKSISAALAQLAQDMNDFVFHVSDSDECGEGEHKMMKIIKENLSETNEKICIYGLDADLIMLSLLSTQAKNIILIRDNTFNSKLKDADKTFTYLNVNNLRQSICSELRSLYKIASGKEFYGSDELLIWDYICLCFLLGNDFLEHLPSLTIKENGINVLLKFYIKAVVKCSAMLVVGNDVNHTINFDVLHEIISDLATSEDYFFTKVRKENTMYRDIHIEDVVRQTHTTQHNNNVYFLKDDRIMYNKPGYKGRYYNYYGVNDIHAACGDYLAGLVWTLGYYDNHSHNNWTWYYAHHAVPFASDLLDYLRKRKNCIKSIKFNSTLPNSTIEQLYMVLPRESLLSIIKERDYNVYKKTERLFRMNSVSIAQYYPVSITVDMINREWLWQAKVMFEPFDKGILKYFDLDVS